MNDALQTTHPYPLDRAFVLKLHRDADLRSGDFRGRLVHVVSDERVDFAGADQLRRALETLLRVSLPLIVHAGTPPHPNA